MKNYCTTLLFALLTFSGFSQAIGYEVFGTQTNPKTGWYPLVTLDTLKEAKTLQDINRRFHPSWVATYNSVELASRCGGLVRKATGTDDTLTPEQLAILRSADQSCSIEVIVDYIPENNLTYNPPRQINFSLNILPIYEAKYPGGFPALKAYLKNNIVDELPEPTASQIELVKVRFTVDEDGQAAEPRVFTSSNDDRLDQFIMEALCNMPKWQPAENAEGQKITQEFEFSMGTDLLRCDYYQY